MFIQVKFREDDCRAYTYAYSGEDEIKPGSYVVVDARGDRKTVKVCNVDIPEPKFECKPVLAILVEKEILQ